MSSIAHSNWALSNARCWLTEESENLFLMGKEGKILLQSIGEPKIKQVAELRSAHGHNSLT